MITSHLPGPVNNPAPGHAHLQAIIILQLDKFLPSRQLVRDTTPVPFPSFIYRDYFPAVYKTCTATAPACNKICTPTAKSTPYLSYHRDNFPAKVPGPVTGWLRQVTQPPFIAGPLALILSQFAIYEQINLPSCY
jgi:hypothetical protein